MKTSPSPYDEALAFLESTINLERTRDPHVKRAYRLDRMACLLNLFDHPERAYDCLHIAGSKGKGSTAVMLASVLEAAGHPTAFPQPAQPHQRHPPAAAGLGFSRRTPSHFL